MKTSNEEAEAFRLISRYNRDRKRYPRIGFGVGVGLSAMCADELSNAFPIDSEKNLFYKRVWAIIMQMTFDRYQELLLIEDINLN